MSSDAVRDAFRAHLTASFPTVAYVESIATRIDNANLPELWQSLQFVAESDGPVSLGSPACYRETGTARVWVVARAGDGDDIAIRQADDVNIAFRRFSGLNGNLHVMQSTPPQNAPESDGRWLLVAIDLRYQYDRYI